MIDKLTEEQKNRIPEYADKWLKVGLCTGRVDPDKARWIANYYYREIAGVRGKQIPVIIMPSPLSTWLAVWQLQVEQQVRHQVWQQVWQKVWHQMEQQVWQQVRHQVEQQVEQQVRQQVWQQVWLQVDLQVEQQVWQQVWHQVWQQVEQQVWQKMRQLVNPYLVGQFSSSYFAHYSFMNEVLDIKFESQEKWDWYQATSEVGLIYPLENYCVFSDRPESIKMVNGRLHSEDSPSIRYTDGFSVYSLHGIRMKPEYVLTPADKITPENILKEQNVDQRRELIRKVGVVRLSNCGKEIEASGTYKLIDMSPVFTGIRYAPYLLMLNPSVPDTWHLEGVSPECTTIEHALNWRKPRQIRDIPTSDDGEDWYQQGDVIVWREGAMALKKYPAVLT